MDKKILVAYASKRGATAGIADKIGQALRRAGWQADVLPVDRAGDLSPYRAVVLGSAVYAGRWRREAAAFLKTNERALAARPVWLFSSGPTGEGDPKELTKGWLLPAGLAAVAGRIRPRGTTVFGGAVDPAKLNALERWMLKNVKAPSGDFRDDAAIAAWAAAIAAELDGETA